MTIDLATAILPLALIVLVTDSSFLISLGGLLFTALFLQRNWGFSPGCAFLGVSAMQPRKKSLSLRDSILRNVTILIPTVIFFEAVMVLFREDGERLGDLLAETRVDCDPGMAGRAIKSTVGIAIVSAIATALYFGHHMNISHPSEFK